ncbi:MAG: energy transducer TonB [Muribaculaceae bacterium]|nr:energy transducer TonB [Muribaculaceae bacterium]
MKTFALPTISMNSMGHIYIGVYNPPLFRSHLVGFPLQVECFPTFNPNIRGISIRERPGELPEITFGPDAAIENMFGNYEIDLSKLTDEQFNLLLNIATPASEELLIFAFDDKTYYILFSPDEYQGTLIKKEIPIKSLSSSSNVQSQSVGDRTVYDSVDTPPSFPGGLGELMSWIGRTMQYPHAAVESRITGRVFVKFVVSADGSIRNAQVVKGVVDCSVGTQLHTYSRNLLSYKIGISDFYSHIVGFDLFVTEIQKRMNYHPLFINFF